MFESGGKLVGFLHAGAERPAADQDQNVTGLDSATFDGGYGLFFTHENSGGAFFAVNTVGVHDRRIDRGGFNNTSFRGDVATRKSHGTGESAGAGLGW